MNRWLDLVAFPVLWIGKASGEPVAKPAYGRFFFVYPGLGHPQDALIPALLPRGEG
jgi:hypothetical protein